METEPSIFTKIIRGDVPGYVPYEDNEIAVLVALEGHLLVVPKTQYRDIYELPEEIGAAMMRVAIQMAKTLKAITNCDGINLIQSNEPAAGQEVFHIHLHVKPRYEDDSMTLAWDTSARPSEERAALTEAIKIALTK